MKASEAEMNGLRAIVGGPLTRTEIRLVLADAIREGNVEETAAYLADLAKHFGIEEPT